MASEGGIKLVAELKYYKFIKSDSSDASQPERYECRCENWDKN